MSESLENKYIYSTKKIGRGSFSKVYKGFNTKTDEMVAIKIIEKEILKKSLLERLYSEINLMYTLDHENIVKIYDHYENDENCYIVLEYCAGGDLNQLLKSTRLNENQSKDYSRQLIKGLEYLRSKSIIHRDLKPHNILLSLDKSILKLADFNFARKLWDGDLAQTLCGSPLYMAPEIISRNDYTTSSDLWSTGIIIYEMIYGVTPYNDAINPMDLLKKIRTRRIPFKNSVSRECNDLLFRLLQINPKRRIPWNTLFRHPWLEEDTLIFSMSDSFEDIELSSNSFLEKLDKDYSVTKNISTFSQLEDSNPPVLLRSDIDTPESLPLKSIIIDDYKSGKKVDHTVLSSTPKAIRITQPEDFRRDPYSTPVSSPRSVPSEFTKNILSYMSSSVGHLSGAVRGAANYLSQ